MADEDYIDAAKLAMALSAEDAVAKARASILEKLQQSITAPPATLSMDKLYEAMRSLMLNGYVNRPAVPGWSFHASSAVVRNPRDAFGTDLRTVDRMANPHKPGTHEYEAWMMHWAQVQYDHCTSAYLQRVAQVDADVKAMEDAHAPVANWVDEVLFEVAEARTECENVPVASRPTITRLGSVTAFGGYEVAGTIADECIDIDLDRIPGGFEIEFDRLESNDDQSVWRATWHIWPKKIGITDISDC